MNSIHSPQIRETSAFAAAASTAAASRRGASCAVPRSADRAAGRSRVRANRWLRTTCRTGSRTQSLVCGTTGAAVGRRVWRLVCTAHVRAGRAAVSAPSGTLWASLEDRLRGCDQVVEGGPVRCRPPDESLQESGAKYYVAMGCHHDNFDMWNSKYQPRWNAANSGPKKDILGSFGRAARQQRAALRRQRAPVEQLLLVWDGAWQRQDRGAGGCSI